MTALLHPSKFHDIQRKAQNVIEHLITLIVNGFSIGLGYSSGKDSSAVLVLMLEALKQAKQQGIRIPPCFVLTAKTLVDNPAVDVHLDHHLELLARYCDQQDLPVHIIVAKPALTATFLYGTVGRGKLPRFVNSRHRECSVDLKISPMEKALKSVCRTLGNTRPVVTLVGTRWSESAVRQSKMEARGDGPTVLVPRDESQRLYSNACIADWDVNEVWELLLACDARRGGVFDTFVPNFNATLDLYRDAQEGACAVIFGDQGQRAPCSGRFGCWTCTITGSKDKSMESMIQTNPDQYGYLEPLKRFRNMLVRTQYDFSRRDWFQRGISKAGFVGLSPDNYSSFMKRDLLRQLITIDCLEEERAEQHAARLIRKEIPDTPENRLLCHPQFQIVTPQLLLAVDFIWGVHRDFPTAFPACQEWYEIRHLGRRYPVPEIPEDAFPPIPVPTKRWFRIGKDNTAYGHPWKVDGLRNPFLEAANPYRRPSRPPYRACVDKYTGEQRIVPWFEEESELSIDPVEANKFLLDYEDLFWETRQFDVHEGVCFLLDRGIVKLPQASIADYDTIARRAQFWERLQQELDVMDIQKYALEHSISNQQHEAILRDLEAQETDPEYNYDLFGFEELPVTDVASANTLSPQPT